MKGVSDLGLGLSTWLLSDIQQQNQSCWLHTDTSLPLQMTGARTFELIALRDHAPCCVQVQTMDLSGNSLSGSLPTEWGENWTDVRFRSLISGATIIFISSLHRVSPALSMLSHLTLCFYTMQVLSSIPRPTLWSL